MNRKVADMDIEVLRTWNPDITIDDIHDFRRCMKTDAIYKGGLPLGCTVGLFAYLVLPKQLGPSKAVMVATSTVLTYFYGKLIYGGGICQEKIFGGPNFARQRRKLQDSSKYVDDIKQADEQNVISSDKLLEDDSLWTNYDTYLDSNASHFDDTGSDLQEELPVEQPKNVKKDLTYDDLWAEHRRNLARDPNSDSESIPLFRGFPTRSSKKPPPSKTAFDEETIWG